MPDQGGSTKLVSVASDQQGTVAVGSVSTGGSSRAIALRATDGGLDRRSPAPASQPPDTARGGRARRREHLGGRPRRRGRRDLRDALRARLLLRLTASAPAGHGRWCSINGACGCWVKSNAPSMSLAFASRLVSGGTIEDRLDESEHRGELIGGGVDVPAARVRRDHDRRHARAEPVEVDVRRRHVVVEPAEVVPRQHDRGRLPVLGSASARSGTARSSSRPAQMLVGGWSDRANGGVSHDTVGSVPAWRSVQVVLRRHDVVVHAG